MAEILQNLQKKRQRADCAGLFSRLRFANHPSSCSTYLGLFVLSLVDVRNCYKALLTKLYTEKHHIQGNREWNYINKTNKNVSLVKM